MTTQFSDATASQTWKEGVQEYEYNKKHLMWGSNPKPKRITYKMKKQEENIFNPISQLYYDNDVNHALKFKEKQEIKDFIAKNYDRTLQYEQTFDVITLQDKFKGLEKHCNFPALYKSDIGKKKVESSLTNYNILSNINLDKHSSLPPEARTKIQEEDMNVIKPGKVNAVNFKDYNIITNKYKNNHEQKHSTDKLLETIHAARNYWKTRDYNCITGTFYDSEKESEFLKRRSETEKNWGKTKSYDIQQVSMFNPVNNTVIDKERLDEHDTKKENKKKRFKIRYDVEKHYQSKNFERDFKYEKSLENKLSYRRYKTIDNRGYNIMNFGDTYEHYKNTVSLRHDKDDWGQILEKAGDNETITKKGVYKDPYDISDIDKDEHRFMQRRKEYIEKLPEIASDQIYSRVSHTRKLTPEKGKEMIMPNVNDKASYCDILKKSEWFKENKNLDLTNYKGKDMTVSKDIRARIMK